MQTSKARTLRYLSPERAKLAWHFRRMANYIAEFSSSPQHRIYTSWAQISITSAAEKAMDIVEHMAEELWSDANQYVIFLLFLELAIMDGTIDP